MDFSADPIYWTSIIWWLFGKQNKVGILCLVAKLDGFIGQKNLAELLKKQAKILLNQIKRLFL